MVPYAHPLAPRPCVLISYVRCTMYCSVLPRPDGNSACGLQIVRENLFKRLYKEVPYNLDIVDVSVKYLRDGSIRIEKHIMVATELVSSTAGM